MHLQSGGAQASKGKDMKIRRGNVELTLAVAALALSQMAGLAAIGQTCMTQELFLYIAPKKQSTKTLRTVAATRKKKTSANVAVLNQKDSSKGSETGDEKVQGEVKKIAERN